VFPLAYNEPLAGSAVDGGQQPASGKRSLTVAAL